MIEVCAFDYEIVVLSCPVEAELLETKIFVFIAVGLNLVCTRYKINHKNVIN